MTPIMLEKKDREEFSAAPWRIIAATCQIIDLVYYHGKSVNEVAEVTGLRGYGEADMCYARKKLAECSPRQVTAKHAGASPPASRSDRLRPRNSSCNGPRKAGCRARRACPATVRDASEFAQFRPASARFQRWSRQASADNWRKIVKFGATRGYLVGVAGFEPATPTSRTWCATRLRYTPPARRPPL